MTLFDTKFDDLTRDLVERTKFVKPLSDAGLSLWKSTKFIMLVRFQLATAVVEAVKAETGKGKQISKP